MPQHTTRVGLQDDQNFAGSARWLADNFELLEGYLAQAGHRLRRPKCSVWAPGLDGVDDADLPEALRELITFVPRRRDSVELLGSDAKASSPF